MDWLSEFFTMALCVYGSVLLLIGLHEGFHVAAASVLGYKIKYIVFSPLLKKSFVEVEIMFPQVIDIAVFLMAPQIVTLLFTCAYIVSLYLPFLGFALGNIILSLEDYKTLYEVIKTC